MTVQKSSGRKTAALKSKSEIKPVLITGGAGFIGTNLADRLLTTGRPVILFDNLSRPGVEENWNWLNEQYGDLVQLERGDVRDEAAVRNVVNRASEVFHFAAQVAVTTSLTNPIDDFEINARGTLNVLEAIRQSPAPPSLIYTSTNKIYGELSEVRLHCKESRYEPQEALYRLGGFSEATRLNFHSPYGCSKGAACQYVLDYARTFQIPAAAFCMSCIYGPHQLGTEDQGWVAHFLISALKNRSITVYGDGRQVRDILFVEDLVDALLLAQENISRLSGQAFNIGGGPESTVSLIELINLIGQISGKNPKVRYQEWRSADQRYYVSDIRKFCGATGWRPAVGVSEGVRRLYRWLEEEHSSHLQKKTKRMEPVLT